MQVDVNDTERSKALSISAEDIETRSSGRRTIPLGGVLNRPVPEEAVLLWITSTIERDYERRVAFPELRANIAQGRQANSSLHILSLEDAQNVLADALETKLRKRGGWLTAYGAYVKSIESAIEGARERKKLFQSAVAVCDYRCAQYERWYGTKPQLQKEGFSLAGPWPGEDGGKRWGAGRDRRGYKARVKTYSSLWPSMYRVDVDVPYSDWSKHQDREALLKAAGDAEKMLDRMPTDRQDFLEAQVAILRMHLSVSLEMLTSPSEFHGYRLDEEAVPTIVEAFDHVVDALAVANIRFDRELHESVIQRHRAAIAAADDRFRSVLDRISSADHSTLQGGA